MSRLGRLVAAGLVAAMAVAPAAAALAAEVQADGSSVDVLFVGHFKIHPHATEHSFDGTFHNVGGMAGLHNNGDVGRHGHCKIFATFHSKKNRYAAQTVKTKFDFQVPSGGTEKYPWDVKLKDPHHHHKNVPDLIGRCHTPEQPDA